MQGSSKSSVCCWSIRIACWDNRERRWSWSVPMRRLALPFVASRCWPPLLDRRAEWCEVFDRGRATSLLLFEHVHAEDPATAAVAMVELMNQYEQAGLHIDCRELPDHLPLYLEYLSSLPADDAREGLHNVADSGAAWRARQTAPVPILSAV